MAKCQQNKMKGHHQFKLHRQMCKPCHLHNNTENDYKSYMLAGEPLSMIEDVHNLSASSAPPPSMIEEWGIHVAAPIPPPPPPAPVGKGGGMRPPPGLLAHPAPAPAGKGAGPLADALADTRQRVDILETTIKSYDDDQTQIQIQADQILVMEAQIKSERAQILIHADQIFVLEAQIKSMGDKFALLETQIKTERITSFANGNDMSYQISKIENRLDTLDAAQASASLSSSASGYEVLKNPSLLKSLSFSASGL
jgi:hypothetical protein